MIWILSALLVMVVVAVLLEIGYQCGVSETERRWAKAVKRKADHDAWVSRKTADVKEK